MSEFEDISIEAPKLKRDTESNKKNRTGIQELWDNYERCTIHVMGMLAIEKKIQKEIEEIFEITMTETLTQINIREQTTDPQSLENTK